MEITRLLLLHEGHQIYYGPTDKITEYLAAIQIFPSKFTNIADFIINMAQAPWKIKEDLTS